jgi:hypothetical protein
MSNRNTTTSLLALFLACSALVSLGRRAAAQAVKPEESFSYAGDIVDQQGRPIAGCEVVATHRHRDGESFGYIATVKTDPRGHFAIERAVALSGASPAAVVDAIIRLEFVDKNHAYARLEDLHVFSREQATKLLITLRDGRSLKGRVVDAKGVAVKGASVDITFGRNEELRRGTVSDADGRFEFHGLPAMAGEITVLTTEPSQPMLTAKENIGPAQTDAPDIALAAIDLPPGSTVHELFGMKLIDVDATLQKLFHLPRADGVLILDPGADSGRLKIGKLQRGDQFWIVGENPVKDFGDFKNRLADAAGPPGGKHSVRVVYSFRRADRAGTNTQYLELSDADVAALAR